MRNDLIFHFDIPHLHDSNDILQKLLYSGPYVKALSLAPLVNDLKARLKRQRAFNLNPLYHDRKI